MLRQGSPKEVTVAQRGSQAKPASSGTSSAPGIAHDAARGGSVTSTHEGTARPAPRTNGRGPASGIGSPIYDELVRELGDPAA